jgi:hypothetical protein
MTITYPLIAFDFLLLLAARLATLLSNRFSGCLLARSLPDLFFNRNALYAARLIDNSLKQSSDCIAVQRSSVATRDVLDHLFLSARRIDRQSHLALYSTYLNRADRSLIEQLDEQLIYTINLYAPFVYVQPIILADNSRT